MAKFDVPVSLYMSSPIVAIRTRDSLERARSMLADHEVSALPVVDEKDRVVGILSRTDLLRVGRREAGSRPGAALLMLPDRNAGDEMTHEVAILSHEASIADAAGVMTQKRIHRVVIEDDGVPVGIFSTRDVMRVIREKRLNLPLSEIMSSPLFTVRHSEPLSLATDRLPKARVTGLVVVEGEWPVGIFAQEEALAARDLPLDTPVEDAMSPAILVLDETLPVHRAAAQAGALDVRRIVVSRNGKPVGIVSGIDFAELAR